MKLVKILDGAFKGYHAKPVKYSTDNERVKVEVYHMTEDKPFQIMWLQAEQVEAFEVSM